MNLAEIRQKAKKEKGDVGAVVAADENVATLSESQIEPLEEALNPLTLANDVAQSSVPAMGRSEAVLQFDPMALILAGRENVDDEERMLTDTGPEKETGDGIYHELLCFRVSSENYAINIMDIKEIIKPREITEVPRVPSFVSGVLSLRGIIIPVFNMRKRLGLPAVQESNKERIIVIKKGEELCGVLVDEVIQVVRIVAASVEPPPTVLDAVDKDFVSGIGRHDGMMLILLNLEKILDVNLC